MRVRVVKRGRKYIKKFSLDTVDWVTILIVILVFCMVMIGVILRG